MYSVTFTPGAQGQYAVILRASGSFGGVAFARTASTQFEVSESLATPGHHQPVIASVAVVIDGESPETCFSNHGFISAFQNARAPFVLVTRSPGISLGDGHSDEIGSMLKLMIPRIATEFGTNKVHIVAHSKRGLFSRYFLDGWPYSGNLLRPPSPDNFGVLSLTTVDTPHHGSAGADMKMAYMEASYVERILNPNVLVGLPGPFTRSVEDLTVDAVGAFNRAHPEPPRLFRDVDGEALRTLYRSISADADNNDKTRFGERYVDANDLTYFAVTDPTQGTILYQIMGNVRSVRWTRIAGRRRILAWRFNRFALNDMIVTVDSARYPGFHEFASVEENHSSILTSPYGSRVWEEIKLVQPMQ